MSGLEKTVKAISKGDDLRFAAQQHENDRRFEADTRRDDENRERLAAAQQLKDSIFQAGRADRKEDREDRERRLNAEALQRDRQAALDQRKIELDEKKLDAQIQQQQQAFNMQMKMMEALLGRINPPPPPPSQ